MVRLAILLSVAVIPVSPSTVKNLRQVAMETRNPVATMKIPLANPINMANYFMSR